LVRPVLVINTVVQQTVKSSGLEITRFWHWRDYKPDCCFPISAPRKTRWGGLPTFKCTRTHKDTIEKFPRYFQPRRTWQHSAFEQSMILVRQLKWQHAY